MDKEICILCDIDGVYTDSREWVKLAPAKDDDREGWDNFSKHIGLCKPNNELIQMLIRVNRYIPILFITSRENIPVVKEGTISQIQDFSNGKIMVSGKTSNRLFMRKENDYRKAEVVKEEILENNILPYYTPIFAIDDEEKNIELFKSKGILSLWYTKLRD